MTQVRHLNSIVNLQKFNDDCFIAFDWRRSDARPGELVEKRKIEKKGILRGPAVSLDNAKRERPINPDFCSGTVARILINLRAGIKNFYDPAFSPARRLPSPLSRATDILYSRKTNYN